MKRMKSIFYETHATVGVHLFILLPSSFTLGFSWLALNLPVIKDVRTTP